MRERYSWGLWEAHTATVLTETVGECGGHLLDTGDHRASHSFEPGHLGGDFGTTDLGSIPFFCL